MNSSILVMQSVTYFTGLKVFAFAHPIEFKVKEVYCVAYAGDFEFEYLVINDEECSIVCH